MESPTSRLPELGLGDWFEDFPLRRVALYALYTLVLFLLFLVVNFPYRVLVDRVLGSVDVAPAELSIGDASFAFNRGLELRGVQVRRPDWSREPILEVPRSYLWPGLRGLLSGNLTKANINGVLYGGRVKARWRGRDVQKVEVQVEDVQLARYPPLAGLFEAGQIYGLLSGYVEQEGRAGDIAAGRASGEIYLDQAGTEEIVYNGLPLLDLAFDEIKVLFTVQGGRVEIEEMSATGPDMLISGGGQIGIRESLLDSVLDLEVIIQAVEDARPEVKGLLTLIPRKRGAKADSPLAITGTLRKPRYR